MTGWAEGYIEDIQYSTSYHEELNPNRLHIPFLRAGLSPPEIRTACELGFGQGINLCIHAATSDVAWYGADINPIHVANVEKLINLSGLQNLTVFCNSFSEFAKRQDLPTFDFISMHGVWSWISEENRRILVDFIRDRLNPGGVLFISYNVTSGWSHLLSSRNLLREYFDRHTRRASDIAQRIDESLMFLQEIADRGAKSMTDRTREHLSTMKRFPKTYLAHEYFNKDWRPMDFAEISNYLEDARLTYACSATYFNQVPGLALNKPQIEFLNSLQDTRLREFTNDVFRNTQFRHDYWIKGKTPIDPDDGEKKLRELQVVSRVPSISLTLKVDRGANGQLDLRPDVYLPIFELLRGYQVTSIGEINSKVGHKIGGMPAVVEALIVLVATGQIELANQPHESQGRRQNLFKLNRALAQLEAESGGFLASGITGGALLVKDPITKLITASFMRNPNHENLLLDTADAVTRKKLVLFRDGKPTSSTEERNQLLDENIKSFETHLLPLLRAHGAV